MDPHPLHDPEFDPYKPPVGGPLRRRRPELEPLSGLRVAATSVVVILACSVAFVGTCAPMSLTILFRNRPGPEPMPLFVPWLVGFGAAAIVGVGLKAMLNAFHRRPIDPDRPVEEKPR